MTRDVFFQSEKTAAKVPRLPQKRESQREQPRKDEIYIEIFALSFQNPII
jgi:hypothetical protein